MQSEITLHRIVFGAQAVVLTIFVSVLIYLDPLLQSKLLDTIGATILIAVAALAFLAVGAVEEVIAYRFGQRHRRELLAYLFLGLVSIASGVFLSFSHKASLQTVALVVAPYAALFGLGELRIARHLAHHPPQRRALVVCGLCEIALAMSLLAAWRLPSRGVPVLLGLTAIVSLAQVLPLLLFSTDIGAVRRGEQSLANAARHRHAEQSLSRR
jgi:hypothetical protein